VSAERQWLRAQQYLGSGQITAAKIALESLLKRDPAHTQAHLTLGGIAWKEDRIRDATAHALAARRLLPTAPALICDVIAALLQVGEIAAARAAMDAAELATTREIPVLMRLSGLCQQWGDHPRALEWLRRAQAAGATGSEFHCYYGVQLTFNGHLQQAEAEFNVCLDADPTAGRAALMLARLRRQTAADNHLRRLERGLERASPGSEDQAALEFALYKELEDLERFDGAWAALARGNAIMRARLAHDPEQERHSLAALIECCTPQFLQREGVDDDGPQPIFVIGLPRSGTTLLERILGNHRDVTSAGELGDFSRQLNWAADHYSPLLPDSRMLERLADLDFAELGRRYLAQTRWRAGAARFYVDKMPANWMIAGLIHKALPNARILHLTRAPMDVCFSNFRAMFGHSYGHSYDMKSLASHFLQYQRLMAHWHTAMPGKILDVAYADLVREPDAAARDVFAFCGLEYQPGCTDLQRNKTAVATLSMAQAREPIHSRAFEEWRPYQQQLEPLRALLMP
jgi:Tfp pilus assembly protein PilF